LLTIHFFSRFYVAPPRCGILTLELSFALPQTRLGRIQSSLALLSLLLRSLFGGIGKNTFVSSAKIKHFFAYSMQTDTTLIQFAAFEQR